MDTALAISQKGICPTRFDDLAALVGLSSAREKSEDLSPKTDKLVGSIRGVLQDAVLRCLERKTAEEFQKIRNEVFPTYFAFTVALSFAAEQAIAQATLEKMINESFCELEADFRSEDVATRFGSNVRDQALFTVWTLRKTANLLLTISKNGISDANKEADTENARNFCSYAAWAQFHMQCLLTAFRNDRPIYPDVSELIIDGLRAAVNAYSFARQGVEFRIPSQEEPMLSSSGLDDEDRELLDSSMKDLDREISA